MVRNSSHYLWKSPGGKPCVREDFATGKLINPGTLYQIPLKRLCCPSILESVHLILKSACHIVDTEQQLSKIIRLDLKLILEIVRARHTKRLQTWVASATVCRMLFKAAVNNFRLLLDFMILLSRCIDFAWLNTVVETLLS